MPLIESHYSPRPWFKNGHLVTVFASALRKVRFNNLPKKQRFTLSDGDFIDLKRYYTNKSQGIVIMVHGLEGNTERTYMRGAARKLLQSGFDVCAMNLRGCSGVVNNKYRSYHSGATQDLKELIDHLVDNEEQHKIYLLGFSLGGNLVLKFLGEDEDNGKYVRAAVGISVPCDLKDTCDQLLKSKNWIYSQRFKRNLVGKLRLKRKMFPNRISGKEINSIVTLRDFDDVYTAPAHGFDDAFDYYAKSSCKQFLTNIQVPSLIINAKNDSFLGSNCYPIEEAQQNSFVFLETPEFGGHVGFLDTKGTTYAEKRASEFFMAYL